MHKLKNRLLSGPQNQHFVLHNSLSNSAQNILHVHIFLRISCY